jgi:hypothetical protein
MNNKNLWPQCYDYLTRVLHVTTRTRLSATLPSMYITPYPAAERVPFKNTGIHESLTATLPAHTFLYYQPHSPLTSLLPWQKRQHVPPSRWCHLPHYMQSQPDRNLHIQTANVCNCRLSDKFSHVTWYIDLPFFLMLTSLPTLVGA